MKSLILMIVFLLMFTIVFRAIPAQAQASADLPIKAQIIGYADSKRICCFSDDNNSWCWQMAPHLWFLNDMIFDGRHEFVPQTARLCA